MKQFIHFYYFFITLGDSLWANMLISSLYLAWFSFFCSISTRRKDFKDSTKSNSWRTRHLGLTSKRKFTRLKISMMSLHISIKITIWECCSQKTSQINWNNQNPRSFLLGFFSLNHILLGEISLMHVNFSVIFCIFSKYSCISFKFFVE